MVVQDPCTARRRNHKSHLPVWPEDQISIEVAFRRVLAPRVRGTFFRPFHPQMRKLTSVSLFKACFWTLTACEVALIWSVNHLRSPVAQRILVFLVHPFANFPPKPHISLPFAFIWSISSLSLAIHLASKSYYRRIRQLSVPHGSVRHVSRRQVRTARRVVHASNIFMAIGSTLCYVGPGSFTNECWVWRMRFGGTLLCLMGVFYFVFWLVVIWRSMRSRRDEAGVSEHIEGVGSSDTSLELEEGTEMLVLGGAD